MPDRPSFETLERYVDEGCVDESVRERIEGDAELESLVDQMRRNRALLEEIRHYDVDGEVDEPGGVDPLIGQTVGGYRVKRAIASGGMGVVYEAVQDKPRRTVALKVMRAGITSRSALRRFEYEAQLLARLRHPGIAQVFEAGTHDDGRARVPYFAMEYIPNARTLTEFAEWKKLPVPERLALFAKVCDAVQQGHQKGIIHRDLKPANILVDSSGQPKIIDFGVARATDSDMAVTTMQTDVGQLIGTLQYMSPEQCDADPHDLDVRSDVYALGVVFYELLTGELPYRIDRATVIESARVICESTPARLSTVSRALGGDIETIALKALEKDRARRYQSASELGQDIQRYLRNEPILARPPTPGYRLRCFVRKHRPLVGAVAAIFLVLSAALVVTLRSYDRERRANRLLVEQSDEDRLVSQIYRDIFSRGRAGQATTIGQAVDQWRAGIDAQFEKPRERAMAHSEVGKLLLEREDFAGAEAEFSEAIRLRRSAYGDSHIQVALSLTDLAALKRRTGALDDAERLYREAIPVFEREYGTDAVVVADQHNNLGTVYALRYRNEKREDDHTRAIEQLETARRVYEKHGNLQTIARIRNNMGAVMALNPSRVDDAIPLLKEALDARIALFGREHRQVAVSMSNLGSALEKTGRWREAESYLRQALEIRESILGADTPQAASTRAKLARILVEGDAEARFDEAEALLEQAWPVLTRDRATLLDLRDAKLGAESLASHAADARPARAEFWKTRQEQADNRLEARGG